MLNNTDVLSYLLNASEAISGAQSLFSDSSLFTSDFYAQYQATLQNPNFRKVFCGNSKLSIFDMIDAINITTSVSPGGRKKRSAAAADRLEQWKQEKLLKHKRRHKRQTPLSPIEQSTYLLAAFNNLNNLVDPVDNCPAPIFQANGDPILELLASATPNTCFCQTIETMLMSMSRTTFVAYTQMAPMISGKLLYAPNTPAYVQLMKLANKTNEDFAALKDTVGSTGDLLADLLPEVQNINYAQLALLMQWSASDVATFQAQQKQLVEQMQYFMQLAWFVRNMLDCVDLNRFVGFATENEAVSAGKRLMNLTGGFWAAAIFTEAEKANATLPDVVKYKIRMNSSLLVDTDYVQSDYYSYGPTNCITCNSYFTYGFIYIQDMLESAVIRMKSGDDNANYGITSQIMPYPCYINDKFAARLADLLPLMMVIAWIYTVAMIVKDIVSEKEKRLKEFMRVMGLSNVTHWCAWFITAFVMTFAVAFLLCIIIKFGQITPHSDLSVLLVFFCCFTIATITQCFLISTFFGKANLAAVSASIIYFLLYLPYTVLYNYGLALKWWQQALASLSSTVAFGYGIEVISLYEIQAVGANWTNFYQTPYSKNNGFTLNLVCIEMLVDAIIYLILTWYIETVFPGKSNFLLVFLFFCKLSILRDKILVSTFIIEYHWYFLGEFGIPRKFYFPLQPSYWCGSSRCWRSKQEQRRWRRRLVCYSQTLLSLTHRHSSGISTTTATVRPGHRDCRHAQGLLARSHSRS